MSHQKPKQSPLDKLLARRDANRETIESLHDLIQNPELEDLGRLEVYGLIARMELCNSRENLWYSNDLKSADNRNYGAIGSLWRCNSRLCTNCLAIHSMRNRKRVRAALAAQTFSKGERLNFITFTIPRVGLPLAVTRELVNRAWRLFQRRSVCRSLLRGGAKSEEFTVRPDGFHYHLHVLAKTPWFLFNELRRSWTDAVVDTFAEANIPFNIPTNDGLLVVNVRKVDSPERAVLELCKYLTKSDSWRKLDAASLWTVARQRHWSRMFELFGSFRDSLQEPDQASDQSLSVHTRSVNGKASYVRTVAELFDERDQGHWRDKIAALGFSEWLAELRNRYREHHRHERSWLIGRHPSSTIYSLASAEPLAAFD